MALDPRELIRRSGLTDVQALRGQLADLKKTVESLLRAPRLQVGDGPPATNPDTLRRGTLYLGLATGAGGSGDQDRLYVVVKNPANPALNVWRWTPVTPWVGNGAPSGAWLATLLEGTEYIDRTGTGTLYKAVNGSWRSVGLT